MHSEVELLYQGDSIMLRYSSRCTDQLEYSKLWVHEKWLGIFSVKHFNICL